VPARWRQTLKHPLSFSSLPRTMTMDSPATLKVKKLPTSGNCSNRPTSCQVLLKILRFSCSKTVSPKYRFDGKVAAFSNFSSKTKSLNCIFRCLNNFSANQQHKRQAYDKGFYPLQVFIKYPD